MLLIGLIKLPQGVYWDWDFERKGRVVSHDMDDNVVLSNPGIRNRLEIQGLDQGVVEYREVDGICQIKGRTQHYYLSAEKQGNDPDRIPSNVQDILLEFREKITSENRYSKCTVHNILITSSGNAIATGRGGTVGSNFRFVAYKGPVRGFMAHNLGPAPCSDFFIRKSFWHLWCTGDQTEKRLKKILSALSGCEADQVQVITH